MFEIVTDHLGSHFETNEKKYKSNKINQSAFNYFSFILGHRHCLVADQGKHILFIQFRLHWDCCWSWNRSLYIPPQEKETFGQAFGPTAYWHLYAWILGIDKMENMQLEGFFFYFLSGFFAGSVIHYLVAKILGPVLFGRGFCG